VEFQTTVAPRRLSEFLSFTQKYRLFLIVAGLIWLLAVLFFHLPLESGPAGSVVISSLVLFMGVSVLAMPRLARWWTRTKGYPTVWFYIACLVLDTALVTATVPLTGGYISISFAFYYFLAIGNCYAFRERGIFYADSFVSVAYIGTLLALRGTAGAPHPLDWADILIIRVPLIYLVSYYARWLARRGDRSTADEQKRYLRTLQGFLTALEVRDGYTRQHSLNVARWSVVLARELGQSDDACEALLHAGELHDVGKIGVPDAILNKPARLTPSEFAAMQSHPLVGVQITEHLDWFTPDHYGIIRHHHERWDGTGYPDRLRGGAIPYLARLLAVCDVFDALTNDRPYRKGMAAGAALELVRDGMGTHFDPDLVRGFAALVERLRETLQAEVGAPDFACATWTDDQLCLRAFTPGGDTWVDVQYSVATGWRVLGRTEQVPGAATAASSAAG
jgi:HD-GYP domain-containing protein (c-di-GMP phosphodiesterase class II)